MIVSKKKWCDIINDWLRCIRRPLYWRVQYTIIGFEEFIIARWKSIVRHMDDQNCNPLDPLFLSCAHDEIQERKWKPIGNINYSK